MLKKMLMFLICFTINSAFSAEIIRSYKVNVDSFEMDKIAKKFEVVKKLEKGFEVYVLEERVNEFLKLAPKAVLLQKNIHSNVSEEMISGYRNYSQVEQDLQTFAETYKSIATLEAYGVTKQGRKLYALKISTGGENKPH